MTNLVECSCDHIRCRILPVGPKLLLSLPVFLMVALGGYPNEMVRVQDRRIATLELDTAYPEPFSYLSSVRELADGRIIAADPISQVVVRLDLDAGTADTLGRQGPGPQEYEGPDEVFPLPGDSTLLIDLGNGRLTVIDPEGTFVAWTPMITESESAPDGVRRVHPQFVDMAGNMYLIAPYWLEGPPDSNAIHRIDRSSGEETPVAWGWRPPRRPPGGKRPMFVAYDTWAVGADGRVAVVRAHGYSVDWYLPDGSMTQGPPSDAETFPVGPAEKEAEVEFYKANATYQFTTFGAGGVESQRTSRGLPRGTSVDVDDFEWPKTMPVFRGGRTLVSPRGEAWVERYMPAGGPGRIDVFDERGVRLGFIELTPGSKVIGFGARVDTGPIVYLARTDDVGLIWLERHRVLTAEGRGQPLGQVLRREFVLLALQ